MDTCGGGDIAGSSAAGRHADAVPLKILDAVPESAVTSHYALTPQLSAQGLSRTPSSTRSHASLTLRHPVSEGNQPCSTW